MSEEYNDTQNSEIEYSDIEQRLAKLSPLGQEPLATRILNALAMVKQENSAMVAPVFPPVLGADVSASHYSSRPKSFSLGSLLVGAIVGAAATLFVMLTLMPPKIEIREVVRVLPVTPTSEIAANSDSKVAAKQIAPDAVAANPTIERGRPRRSVEDQLALADPLFKDIDALVSQRENLARHIARYESETNSTVSNPIRPRFSPEAYGELIRDLSLRP